MKIFIFATTLLVSATVYAQDVSDAPMAEVPAVEMAGDQDKSDFLKPVATPEDMKQIQQAEHQARMKDKKLQKAKRAPASVSEPELERKKKTKKKKKKKKTAHL